MQLDRDYEVQCKQIWVEAWVRVAQASNCVLLTSPTTYADECLKQYKSRFVPYVNDDK